MKASTNKRTYHWLWAVLFMLVLTFIVGTRLDMDGLWYDEVFTVRNAGGAGFGPLSPVGVYQTIQADDPYQAVGYPMTIAAWGAVVGWSEFASRVSSLLFMLITLALTYRLGRDVSQSAWGGVISALMVGFLGFTVHYAHELRAFTFVTIWSTLTAWAYWHILRRPSRTAYLVFLVGGIGIVYAHYYSAMLLIGIGIYHVLFAPKNKQWFYVPLCGLLMTIAFLPQMPAFIEGFTRFDTADVAGEIMSADAVIGTLLYYAGNGQQVLIAIVLLVSILPLLRSYHRSWMIIAVTIISTIVLIISNELLDILEPTRIRYAIFLFPLSAVWIASGVVYVADWVAQRANQPQLRLGIIGVVGVLWLINGVGAIYDDTFTDRIEGTETPRMRSIVNEITSNSASTDIFAFYNGTADQAWYFEDTFAYSTSFINMPSLLTALLYDEINENNRQYANQRINEANRIWYGANLTFGLNEVHTRFIDGLQSEFVLCDEPINNDELLLQLWARSDALCDENSTEIMRFSDFTLSDYDLTLTEDTLSLALGWELAPDTPPHTYSLAVHITSPNNPTPIAQADVGMPVDDFVPMVVELELSDLPTGEYNVVLLVYEWRTGERLQGRNLQTGQTDDRLTLATIAR